jgi:hypothetical protein
MREFRMAAAALIIVAIFGAVGWVGAGGADQVGPAASGRVLAPIDAVEGERGVIPPQCGDSVDLPWRCYIASYSEVAQVLQSLEDDCFDIHTLGVAPWRLGPVETDGTRYVVEYLVTGRRLDKPCP